MTTSTTVSAPTTTAGSAMDLAPSTIADAPTSPPETATGRNQLDALGVCGAIARPTSMEMASATTWTTAWAPTTTAASAMALAPYDCGCADIPAGDCDCDGNQLDVIGVCGGDCTADLDGDGVRDDVDLCIGEFDECGICNGPGAIYECDAPTSPPATATATETSSMPLASVVATANPTSMEMASVTPTKSRAVRMRMRPTSTAWRRMMTDLAFLWMHRPDR